VSQGWGSLRDKEVGQCRILESLRFISVVCNAKPMGTFGNDGDGAQTQRHRGVADATSIRFGFPLCVDVLRYWYRSRLTITKLNEIWPTGRCCGDITLRRYAEGRNWLEPKDVDEPRTATTLIERMTWTKARSPDFATVSKRKVITIGQIQPEPRIST
jgi:hypothetical protein